MVELVYKFDDKSTASVRKGESTAQVSFKPLFWVNVHVYKWDTNPDHIAPAHACACGVITSIFKKKKVRIWLIRWQRQE